MILGEGMYLHSDQQNQIWAISPLDGRYASKLSGLRPLTSEGGLVSYRIRVEAAWLLFLQERAGLALGANTAQLELLRGLREEVPQEMVFRVKDLERTTNHDVKAVEYAIRDALLALGDSPKLLAHIHFACTSEDINNTAYGWILKDLRKDHLLPAMDTLLEKIRGFAERYRDLRMISRTHGQIATPTTLGKEMAVFGYRLGRQRQQLAAVELEGKFSGAVGNYNAHMAAYPELDWFKLSREFLEEVIGLKQNPLTTQIENHDTLVEYCDAVRRFNTIGIDFCRDMWAYISIDYFRQVPVAGETGSSTMPHKVNPIDFENAEGNLGMANGIAEHFAAKLPISRWQRDLSDSTVLRSLGTLFGHSILAYQACIRGMKRVEASPQTIGSELDGAHELLAEAVQTVMRRYGIADAYERLKKATRGQKVSVEVYRELLESCSEVPDVEKVRLLEMTPRDYVGLAARLADVFVERRN